MSGKLRSPGVFAPPGTGLRSNGRVVELDALGNGELLSVNGYPWECAPAAKFGIEIHSFLSDGSGVRAS